MSDTFFGPDVWACDELFCDGVLGEDQWWCDGWSCLGEAVAGRRRWRLADLLVIDRERRLDRTKWL